LTREWVELFRLSNNLGLNHGSISLSSLLLFFSSGKGGGESIVGFFRSSQTFPGTGFDLGVKFSDCVNGESLQSSVSDEEGELSDGKTGLGDVERGIGAEKSSSSVE
jgi:hypothetical protein